MRETILIPLSKAQAIQVSDALDNLNDDFWDGADRYWQHYDEKAKQKHNEEMTDSFDIDTANKLLTIHTDKVGWKEITQEICFRLAYNAQIESDEAQDSDPKEAVSHRGAAKASLNAKDIIEEAVNSSGLAYISWNQLTTDAWFESQSDAETQQVAWVAAAKAESKAACPNSFDYEEIESAGQTRSTSAASRKESLENTEENTGSKPQTEQGQEALTKENNPMSTPTTPTPKPGSGNGGKGKTGKRVKSTLRKEDLQQIVIQVGMKMGGRVPTADETLVIRQLADKHGRVPTIDEAVEAVNQAIAATETNEAKDTEATLETRVTGVLGRELTERERGKIHEAVERAEDEGIKLNETEYEEYVVQIARHFRQVEDDAKSPEEKDAETRAANAGKAQEWDKAAEELEAALVGTKESPGLIGRFSAMRDDVDTVRNNFKAAKKVGATILPDRVWHDKAGKEHIGFTKFEDFCNAVLKRSKQAVYAMLAEPKAKKPKERDKSVGAAIKRGATSFFTLYSKVHATDPGISFESLMQSIVNAVRMKAREDADKERNKESKNDMKLAAIQSILKSEKEEQEGNGDSN